MSEPIGLDAVRAERDSARIERDVLSEILSKQDAVVDALRATVHRIAAIVADFTLRPRAIGARKALAAITHVLRSLK